MNIVDLTHTLHQDIQVYPGDPGFSLTQVETIEECGRNVQSMSLTGHVGTHINIPYHIDLSGKKMHEYELSDFIGSCVYYTGGEILGGAGILVQDEYITMECAREIIAKKCRFAGFGKILETDIEVQVERYLLEQNIINYENLTSLEILPPEFMFYGIPLSILNGDGSPVRAFAVLD